MATAAEIPGLLLATRYINRVGRTSTCAACMVLASLAFLGIAAIGSVYDGATKEDAERSGTARAATGQMATAATAVPGAGPAVLQIVLLAVSRMAAFGGFSALYVLTAESYPTGLRTTAFGVVSAASRCAGILTPLVAGTVWHASPSSALFVYAGAAALCAGVLRLAIRETSGEPMPDLQAARPVLSCCAISSAPPTRSAESGVHDRVAFEASTRSFMPQEGSVSTPGCGG